jgi:hypothetical protein
VNASLAPGIVCTDDPGHGYEEEGGFKLLTEKIQAVEDKNETSQPVRPFVIYTHDKMRDPARASALSWDTNAMDSFPPKRFPRCG